MALGPAFQTPNSMKSTKQRRSEIKTRRIERDEKRAARLKQELIEIRARYIENATGSGGVAVSAELLGHHVSYSDPEFLTRGTYLPMHFVCAGCGKEEIWTAHQQKWWYEVAKGDLFSVAKRCRPCRAIERKRKADARRVHLDGVNAKKRTADKSQP